MGKQTMKVDNQKLPLLFSRLTWPSGMVRERACTAIADLLVDSQWAEIVHRHLICWIKEQMLESLVGIGLLIYLRARLLDSNLRISAVEELLSALHRPSVLSWMLINELAPSRVHSPNWTALNSGSAPGDFEPAPFFIRYSRNFLPSKYTDLAERIEETRDIPFIRQWAFEWHKILERIGKKPSLGPMDFTGMENSDHYVVIDFELSEVYRSAYLRALAWAIMLGVLSETDAQFLAIIACPIDLGLWRLKPTSRPAWWPTPHEPEGKIDTVPAQIGRQIELLWDKQRAERDDWIIGGASGRVHEGATIYDLEIFGFFQICLGALAPNPEELADWYRRRKNLQYVPWSLHFRGGVDPVSPQTMSRNFGDWSVLPAVSLFMPYTTPRWQYWRIYRGVWLPSPFLCSKRLTFQCSDEALIIRDGEEIIGKWNDWTDGLREKVSADLNPSTGQYLLLQREKVEAFASETKSVFCWICRLAGHHREYDYQPYKHFADHRLYGTTSIVIRH